MTTTDQDRITEIERELHENKLFSKTRTGTHLRFLIDRLRQTEGILSDRLEDQGMARLDALLAEAEQRAALKCREICIGKSEVAKRDRGLGSTTADRAAYAITAAFNLPPLEEPGR